MTYEKYLKLASKRAISLNKEPEAIKLLMLELSNKSGAEFLAAFKDEIDEELIKVYDQAIDKYLINNVKTNGCLIEVGFLSNIEEMKLLCDLKYQDKVSYCIYLGIIEFLAKNNNF